jgi:hypothetical protein
MNSTAPTPDSAVEASLREKLASREWRLNNLYKIKDKHGNLRRFRLNAVQKRVDAGLHNLNIILKARQHGITTWACIRALDIALFRSNTSCGLVFHTKDDAREAFIDKILFAYDELPASIRAARPVKRRDMNGVLELSNGSKITVSLSHRSGTLQWLHISEYGRICSRDPLRAKEIQSGALNTVAPGNYVTIESTAEGSFGDFYAKCQAALTLQRRIASGTAKLGQMDYKVHFLPWFEDPTYQLDPDGVEISDELAEYFAAVEDETGYTLTPSQRAWYAKKRIEQGDQMWKEYPSTPEEAFKAAKDGTYFGKLMTRAESEGRILQPLPVRPGAKVHVFWDIGSNDTNVLLLMQHNGDYYDWIDSYANNGEAIHHYAQWLQQRAMERGYVYGFQHLPHDAAVTDYSREDRKSRREVLEGLGFKVKVVPRISTIGEGIDMTRQMLPLCRFDKVRCGELLEGEGVGLLPALATYRKEWSDVTGTFRDHPLHDWSSNWVDAFRQAAQGFEPEKQRQERRKKGNPGNWKTA